MHTIDQTSPTDWTGIVHSAGGIERAHTAPVRGWPSDEARVRIRIGRYVGSSYEPTWTAIFAVLPTVTISAARIAAELADSVSQAQTRGEPLDAAGVPRDVARGRDGAPDAPVAHRSDPAPRRRGRGPGGCVIAVLDIRGERTAATTPRRGRVLSLHATQEEGAITLAAERESQLGDARSMQSADPRYMWTLGEVEDDAQVGDRVRYDRLREDG